MRILILVWRDIRHPSAGGSEFSFHEMAKIWIRNGNSVDWISGGWAGCKKKETIDQISITRVGGQYSLYVLVPFVYMMRKEKPDIIIDVENGFPFFSPLFSRRKKILHIHHIHKDVWFKEFGFLKALLGCFLEDKIMPFVYRNQMVITPSESSAQDVLKQKYCRKKPAVVNPGIKFYEYSKEERSKKPTVLFLNRVKRYKGLDILLDAVKKLKDEAYYGFKVLVAGSGDALPEMKAYARENGLSNVTFLGAISEDKKVELMQKAWLFVNPSFKEGWGIVNIEANYFGTPVIGSDVSGIRDSVINGKTGLLFEYGKHDELARKIRLILENRDLREMMSKEAKKWARHFSWEKAAKEYLGIMQAG